jgi:outer membrane protein OmpA-like peptidoglycan-associated protein
MAKGVKKIKWTGEGTVKSSLSIPNKKVTIDPDQFVLFSVGQWDEGISETDKKKNLTWMLQDRKAKTIIKQKTLPFNNKYGVKIPRNLCGPFEYYVEASLSGKRDLARESGLRISGYCEPRIKNTKWCTTNDGADVSKTHIFSYGNTIYLNIETEGLNGHKSLIVDVFRLGTLIFTYTSVDVIDGEINLAMSNTFSWYGKIKPMKETEQFYIKVKDPTTGKYIVNNKQQTEHAKFLQIKKKIASPDIKTPTNLTPLKVGKPDANAVRYEPFKFETIAIEKTIVFNKGEKLKKLAHPKETIKKTLFFDIDSSIINEDGKTRINNVLQFLLEHDHSTITIDGYACVIGKENYNQGLSQRRSDAVKKTFINGGLDAQRIISRGHGEINATDDKMGRDNIKYKDTREYIDSRKVNISFVFNGHDAQTIVYETIAPSHDKNITIDITEYQNKACFREKGKHQKKIIVSSPEYSKPLEKVGTSLTFPVRSNLEYLDPAPLHYIWPKVFANEYFVHAHSCRYFSNDKNATIVVNAYPDIKWELAFELKIDVENYSHNHMPAKYRIFEKHQKIATKEGYKRWLLNKNGEIPIVVGIGLKAEWDDAQRKVSLTKEWEKKTEVLAKGLAKSVDLIQGAINVCRGVLEATSIPISFGVNYPKFEVVASWYLQKEDNYLNLAMVGKVNFGAKPFIGANATIDLIAAAVTIASYGTTGSPAISKIVSKIRKAGKKVGAEISADAKFYGEIEIMFNDLLINSIKGTQGGFLLIGGEMGMKLIVEVKAGNNPWYRKKEPIIEFDAIARATGDAYFGGEMKIDSDERGIYIEPTLLFSGLEVTLEAEVTIGWFKDSVEKKFTEVVPKKEIKLNKHYLN